MTTATPSPLVAAFEHAVAVLRSLNAARGLVVPRYTPVVTAMIDRAIAQQSALMRSLNAAYEAEQKRETTDSQSEALRRRPDQEAR